MDSPKTEHVNIAQLIGKLWPWKTEVVEEGRETWTKTVQVNYRDERHEYSRHFVKYKTTNHFTGSVKIFKEYLS